MIPQFVDAALGGRPVPIHGDGTQSRDFTYVGTVCAVLHDAVAHGVTSNDPVNLAFGTNTEIGELVGMLEDELGPLERENQPSRVGDVRASQSDGSGYASCSRT